MSNSSDNFSTDILKLLFQNIALANIGDAAGLQPSAAPGNFYIRLCTDAVVPSKSVLGTQAAYTGYAAGGLAVVRSAAGFTVTGQQIKNAADLVFGARTAGDENIRYAELWKNNSGSTIADRIAFCQLTADLAVTTGIQPKISAETLVFNFS